MSLDGSLPPAASANIARNVSYSNMGSAIRPQIVATKSTRIRLSYGVWLAPVVTTAHNDVMIRTQISLDADLYARAKELARRQGISLAELCRRSLEEAVARQPSARAWMAFAGTIDGRPEDSSTVDLVVYGRNEP
jgi:hypothetical protein